MLKCFFSQDITQNINVESKQKAITRIKCFPFIIGRHEEYCFYHLMYQELFCDDNWVYDRADMHYLLFYGNNTEYQMEFL